MTDWSSEELKKQVAYQREQTLQAMGEREKFAYQLIQEATEMDMSTPKDLPPPTRAIGDVSAQLARLDKLCELAHAKAEQLEVLLHPVCRSLPSRDDPSADREPLVPIASHLCTMNEKLGAALTRLENLIDSISI